MIHLSVVAAARDATLVGRWARLYSDNKYLSASIMFAHLAGVLVGGGLALATDRASFTLAPAGSSDRTRQLTEWATIHRWVVGGLALTAASGLLQLFADLSTYHTSPLFWTKMAVVTALLVNGYVRLRAERALLAGRPAEAWFRRTSAASAVLWLGALLAGAMLTTIA